MSDPADTDQSEQKLLALAGLLTPADPMFLHGSDQFRAVVEALPAAIYITRNFADG